VADVARLGHEHGTDTEGGVGDTRAA
jgi:hypothetical protein